MGTQWARYVQQDVLEIGPILGHVKCICAYGVFDVFFHIFCTKPLDIIKAKALEANVLVQPRQPILEALTDNLIAMVNICS